MYSDKVWAVGTKTGGGGAQWCLPRGSVAKSEGGTGLVLKVAGISGQQFV